MSTRTYIATETKTVNGKKTVTKGSLARLDDEQNNSVRTQRMYDEGAWNVRTAKFGRNIPAIIKSYGF